MGSIDAFNIKCGSSVCLAQRLRLGQHCLKSPAFFTHFCHDKVARAINDASQPVDLVGGQCFTQNFNNGNAQKDILNYAESKLLPYFKELKPENFSIEDFITDLARVKTEEEYNKTIEDAKYVSISPAYIWLDSESNDRLNPKYVERSEAGEPLVNFDYKGGILKNKKYEDTFKMVNGVPTQNVKKMGVATRSYQVSRSYSNSCWNGK